MQNTEYLGLLRTIEDRVGKAIRNLRAKHTALATGQLEELQEFVESAIRQAESLKN